MAMPYLGRTGLVSYNATSMAALKDRLLCVLYPWVITTHARHCDVFVFFLAILLSLVHDVTSLLYRGHNTIRYEGII